MATALFAADCQVNTITTQYVITKDAEDLVHIYTFFARHIKSIGTIYLQALIDCLSRYA